MRRIKFIFIFYLAFFLVIIARLFYWQILSSGPLSAQGESQRILKLTLPSKRGEIYSRDGSPLVVNQPAFLVFAEPKKITAKKETASKIAKIFEVSESSISASLKSEDLYWVALSHKVDEEKAKRLKDLSIEGLGFEKEDKRFYPEASMASHLLGFVGYDPAGSDKGYFGLEGFYNRELAGRPGMLRAEKDARGAQIVIGEGQRIEPQDGRDLFLNLDRTVQYMAEKNLEEGLKKYGAKEGTVIIMDPQTGGILGMASLPSYEEANYQKYEKERYQNPAVAQTYEPGSTFKVLVMAAAINEGVLKPQDTYEEVGPVKIGDYTIKTWNEKYHGQITMTQVLEKSSNVGMVYVGQKLGIDKLYSYLENFGFGTTTDIDLEEETAAGLRKIKDWREIDLATASFGQGIAVTPLQMIRAVSALANGGKLMTPQVVSKIVESNKRIIEIKPKEVREVISPKTGRILTEMMVASVENGEANFAKPKGYRIAGKTGTAQIPVSGHYDTEKTIASFVGFAPADNPKFVMLVTLREPTSSPWGSETAAPLFFSIAKELFNYYAIPPSE